MDVSRRRFTALALLLAAALGCAQAPHPCDATGGRPPSYIVVVADTLRADFVSRGAGAESLTPALDAFASEGITFTSAFSQAPLTPPSVASLLTGLHPQTHGLVSGSSERAGILSEDNQTLPEVLSESGYETAAFVANQWLMPGWGFEQGFEHYEYVKRGQVGNIFAHAMEWLAARDSERPYFLYLHLMEVHGPYTAPERFVDDARRAIGDEAGRPISGDEFDAIPDYMLAYDWTREARARDLAEWRTRYGAGVAAFDAAFGRFAQIASERGVLDDAVVLVTSDHGEELLDHGSWGHGATFYDELLHVPLILRLPGARNGGREVASISSLIDVMPTLLALAGLEEDLAAADVPDAQRGRDRSAQLCDASPPREQGQTIASAAKHDPHLYSLRTPEYKMLLHAEQGLLSLFDLSEDPGEQRDVLAQRTESARRLERTLRDHVAAMGDWRTRGQTAPVDPEVRAQLEALGYVDPAPGV